MNIEQKAGAWRLLGSTLESGWKIVEPVGWDPNSGQVMDHYNGTGGNFSVPYIVEKEGKRAFLKAIDLTNAMNAVDVMAELQAISAAHTFETAILKVCEGARMDKVVVAMESGQLRVGPNLQDTAPYLIFELADGDVRRRIQKRSGEVRLAWWLKAMHHAAIGLSQLHSKKITHQDLKPSNVLSFEDDATFKVSDLGRCTSEDNNGPYDSMAFAGDWAYAPPEILYGHINPDAFQRRLACDLYLLGSLIFFFAMGFGSTQLLADKLSEAHRPMVFRGMWSEGFGKILPILQTHFTEIIGELEAELVNNDICNELLKAASELSNPDPSLRGHPQSIASGDRYSLERYISLFDRLSKLASIQARKASEE
ncbi:protein kinase [Phaeobacter sp. JH18-32]|uniref:protein kinase domain-containing protein n=1 Tax=Phaeobacter TaxID=302485 RepID=UPI003A888270